MLLKVISKIKKCFIPVRHLVYLPFKKRLAKIKKALSVHQFFIPYLLSFLFYPFEIIFGLDALVRLNRKSGKRKKTYFLKEDLPMKTFMEEYGLIVVAAIVIMIFVVVATPVGEALRDGVIDVIKKLTEKLEAGLSVTADSVSI